MKLAEKSVLNLPEDYEDERMPTPQEAQAKAKKSHEAAENAVKSSDPVPKKSIESSSDHSTNWSSKGANKADVPALPTPKHSSIPSSVPLLTEQSHYSPLSPTLAGDKSDANSAPTRKPSFGGLVLPKKLKSDNPSGSTPNSARGSQDSGQTPKSAEPSSTHKKGLKRRPSYEGEFSSMAADPESLMVVLKKYKAQSEQLRRVRPFDLHPRCGGTKLFSYDSFNFYFKDGLWQFDGLLKQKDLIREKQRAESLQESIDKYEKEMATGDKMFRENILKEAKRRKDAEYIANVLKKRVTELQFLLDEKDSDTDSSNSENLKEEEEWDRNTSLIKGPIKSI